MKWRSVAATVFPGFLAFVCIFFCLICIKSQLKHFHFGGRFRSLEVVRDHQKVKHWIRCCYCIPWVLIFCLIFIQQQLKHFHFGGLFRSLEVVRDHQKVKHWIRCSYYIPWVPSFRLICIKPQLKHYILEVFLDHQRSLEVI